MFPKMSSGLDSLQHVPSGIVDFYVSRFMARCRISDTELCMSVVYRCDFRTEKGTSRCMIGFAKFLAEREAEYNARSTETPAWVKCAHGAVTLERICAAPREGYLLELLHFGWTAQERGALSVKFHRVFHFLSRRCGRFHG